MPIRKRFLIPLIVLISSFISIYAQENDELRPSTTSFGTLVFDFNVDSALVILNNQYRDAFYVYKGDTVNVKTGETSIKISVMHDYLFEKVLTVIEDSLFIINHDFQFLPLTKKVLNGNFAARRYFNANLLVITDEDSDIYLNEELVGKEFVYLNAPTGNNLVQARNSTTYQSLYVKNSVQITNSDFSFRIIERHIKPLESTSKTLSFLPGFSQAYKYQGTKALFIRASLGTLFAALSALEVKYRIDKKEYDDLLFEYRTTKNSSNATNLGDILETKDDNLKTLARYRNISLFTLIGTYVYNIADGLISKPKSGFRQKKPYSFYLDTDSQNNLSMNIKVPLGN